MYKIMILLNTFSSEIGLTISNKVHVDPTVEMGLRVCSNSYAPLTVMPIFGKIMIIKKNTHSSSSKPRTAQMIILSLVSFVSTHNICFLREIRKNVNFRASKSWLSKRILTIYLSVDK